MTSHHKQHNSFEWDDVWEQFDWNAPDEFNVTHEVVTRNVGQGGAIHWEGEDTGRSETLTYTDLDHESARVANALESLGVERGEPVATMVPRVPELYPMFLGIWRHGAVYVPLFTAFGPEAITARAGDADVDLILTTPPYRDRIASVEDEIGIDTVIVLDRTGEGDDINDNDIEYATLLADQSDDYKTIRTSVDDPCTVEYTSGTTGPPKGCVLTHRVLAALYPYLWYGMDLSDTEVIWGAADPGWMYGLLSAGIAPVSMGIPNVLYEGEFDPEAWYRILETYDVTSLATSPTAYRGLMAAGDQYQSYDLALAKGHSAGEPLNPEVVNWFQEKLSTPVYDHYGVTECGMIICNQHADSMEVKRGSMGTSLPGFSIRILDNGEQVDPGECGEIAVKRGEGTYFNGYLNRPEKTAAAWVKHDGAEWFTTGDAAYVDEDGYIWFVGRTDDVIISSGYRIGPFEVESALIEHDHVTEAAIIGVPDEKRGEIVKAFVVVRDNVEMTDGLKTDIREFVKERLAKHAYPREIEFVDDLPKTASGKIRRVELREQEET